jgi:acetolactate synthase regulatory subunit
MVRQWQELFHQNRLSHVELDTFPDAGQLAEAYGLRGLTLDNPKSLAQALHDAASTPGPCLLNVKVAPYENVYPMVPSGAGIHEMVLGPDYPNSEPTSPQPMTSPARPHDEAAPIAQKSLVVLLENVPGALQRILTIITAQGCTVKSLSANPTAVPGQLRVTLALEGGAKALSRVVKRVSKLVNVLETSELQLEVPDHEVEASRLTSELFQLDPEELDPLNEFLNFPSVQENAQPDAPKQSFRPRRKRWAQECDAGAGPV